MICVDHWTQTLWSRYSRHSSCPRTPWLSICRTPTTPSPVKMALYLYLSRWVLGELWHVNYWVGATSPIVSQWLHIDGLVQKRRNSIANALELCLTCTNPSIWWYRSWSALFQLMAPAITWTSVGLSSEGLVKFIWGQFSKGYPAINH